MRVQWVSPAALLLFCASAACTRAPRSEDEARARLAQAVRAGDGRALYDLVDEATRWSIDSTWKYHQQCLALVEESYPPELQARETARFLDAASARDFVGAYERQYHLLPALAERAASPRPGDLVRERDGRVRVTILRAQWEDIKQRASHDLDTVRENAVAFGRAAR
jgi:hypothetical protein